MVDQEFLEIPRDIRGTNWRIEKLFWITNNRAGIWTRRLKQNEIIL